MIEAVVESSAEIVHKRDGIELLRILHVDDDLGQLKIASQFLELDGSFRVDRALSVDQALEKIRQENYDVIISDYQMPGRDGLDFLRELRREGCNIPFIVFTGRSREEIAIEALNLGANYYLNKIGRPETVYGELAHEIHQVVKTRRAEERLRDALDSMLEGCQIIDRSWCYVYVNDAASSHGRNRKEDLLGKTMMEMYPGIETTAMFQTLRGCMENRVPARIANEFEFPDGKKGWFDLSITPVPEGILILSIDTTDLRQAEHAARKAQENYQSLCQNIPGMVYRARPDWSTEIISNSENICGYSVEEFNQGNLNWLDLIHPEDRERVSKEAAPIRGRASGILQEYRIIDKAKNVRWVEDRKTSVFSKDGILEGVDGIVFDITYRKTPNLS